jgi:murein DD-endopeptidase MepM/ murein hydrolase activator NlpD
MYLKSILVFMFMVSSLFSAKVTHEQWGKGKTFSDYLISHDISVKLLDSISKEDLKFLSEIQSYYTYYELKNTKGELLQTLIPINDEMQIHLFKKQKSDIYGFDIIPIEYQEEEHFAKVIISKNPYTDTMKTVNEKKVAERLGMALKKVVNAQKWRKGDEVSFVYTQKTRFGGMYLMPNVKTVSVKQRGKEKFIFVDEDGYGHLEDGKASAYANNGDYIKKVRIRTQSHKFRMPLRHVRITSKFTYRRWHPILKRYRPHHGTDFGARRGTPLLAVYSGKVSFAGRMGGYGKVVKIKHPRGYESLYAHQSRIKVRRGQHVKKGQIIGYVGSTGRSTGPHLHFGLKRNGRWVNPMKVLKKESLSKKIKYKKLVIKDAKQHKAKLMDFIKNENATFHIWDQSKKGIICCTEKGKV